MRQTELNNETFKRETLSAKIATKLRKDIFTGVLPVGGMLPPEREIAERFGVSRVTVRQALQELAKDEWIEIVQGRGATVLDFTKTIGLHAMPSLLSTSPEAVVNPQTFKTLHLFANWMYEQICGSAAARATEKDEERLLRIVNSYQYFATASDYLRIEEAFYNELLRIGDNLVLRMFFNTYMKTFRMVVETGLFQKPPLSRELYIKVNTELAKAVCSNQRAKIHDILLFHKNDILIALNEHFELLGVNIYADEYDARK